MIALALEAYRLKDTVRTGWALRGVREPESVADHSWGTALLCMIYGPAAGIDVGKAVCIAVVHDLAECRVGDVPARVSAEHRTLSEESKHAAELAAMEELAELFAQDIETFVDGRAASATDLTGVDAGIRELWQQYEDRESAEAVFVRDMNLIDMCLQALVYEEMHAYDPAAGEENFPDFTRLDEFFATSGPRIATPVGHRLYDEVHARYRALVRGS